MREVLETELRQVLNSTLNMLGTVERMYALVSDVVVRGASEKLAQVKAIDLEVDDLEAQIEADCLRIIALHQPVARDLRMLGLVLKSLSDIERMGDYAVHVAEDSQGLTMLDEHRQRLEKMLIHLEEMSNNLRTGLADRDVARAEATIRMDDEVDTLYSDLQRDLVAHMTRNPEYIETGLSLLRIGRSIERIGDHMENVAERVRYWVTGEREG
ncbi:phosphate signaling complex protein PhoU [Deinococcus lacus]|uniref:Phosphate-specific transport system accessory protein PhoU n=1 Tax=Deinococcus lacus TaxID=392561 RepID=A0ABW1YEL4_9DEIO